MSLVRNERRRSKLSDHYDELLTRTITSTSSDDSSENQHICEVVSEVGGDEEKKYLETLPKELYRVVIEYLDPKSAVVFLCYTTKTLSHCKVGLEYVQNLALYNVSHERFDLMSRYLGMLHGISFYFNHHLNNDSIRILSQCNRNLMSIQIYQSKSIDDEALEIVSSKLREVETLRLYHCSSITDHGFRQFSALENLTCLDLYACAEITPSVISMIPAQLTELDLSHILLSEMDGSAILKFKVLRSLRLAHTGILDHHVESICRLEMLEFLDLTACMELSDDAFEDIAMLINLTTLDLTYVTRISDVTLKEISRLEKIEELNLGFCDAITTTGLKNIIKIPNLKRLDLSKTYTYDTDNIDYDCIESLTNLNTLSLGYCPFEPEILQNLSALTTLDISNNHDLENSDIADISKCNLTSLTSLDISNCPLLTSDIKEYILQLPQLKTLYMYDCFINYTQKQSGIIKKKKPHLVIYK